MNFPSESQGLSEEVRGARGGGERWRQRKGEPESSAAAGRVLNIELLMKTNNLRWGPTVRWARLRPPALQDSPAPPRPAPPGPTPLHPAPPRPTRSLVSWPVPWTEALARPVSGSA